MFNDLLANNTIKDLTAASFHLEKRRAKFFDLEKLTQKETKAFLYNPELLKALDEWNRIYRTLCGVLFNYVPKSGHPGGSISSGHIVAGLLFSTMDYSITHPHELKADHLCYGAGHKAMGLYSAWALRNEVVRICNPSLLPSESQQLRLEDLLGFRRNPTQSTPLFKKYHSKPLDGHPSPIVPFVRVATGASGVGDTVGIGLALGAMDYFGPEKAPNIHILEGECGLTPGRVFEGLSCAAVSQLSNTIIHVDWNQASIDSNHVCREGEKCGDYAPWDPKELFYLHDWNVIYVPNGFDFQQVLMAQNLALQIKNQQPTAIVYRTVKGWNYGIEGMASHGAGHDFCSDKYYQFLKNNFEDYFGQYFPRWAGKSTDSAQVEQHYFDCLMVIREVLEKRKGTIAEVLTKQLVKSKEKMESHQRVPRKEINIQEIYSNPILNPEVTPEELKLEPGTSATLREALGDTLHFLNKKTGGAILGAAADLYGSTNLKNLNKGFNEGFYNAYSNPDSRLISVGGICEDGIAGVMAGVSAFGRHIGVGSSYGAFIAALQHVTARLHAIGQEAHLHASNLPSNPFIIVCAHAGPKTGEDGPTHADPQALQLFSENFPSKSCITLTPLDPLEIWPLLSASLRYRPAIIVPFVSRPAEKIVDRKALGLPPASLSTNGIYPLIKANGQRHEYHGTVVIRGNGVGESFIQQVLPQIQKLGLNMNIYYVSSIELFDRLRPEEQESIFPERHAREAMGITEFTLSTILRFVTSREGQRFSLHTFKNGHFMGSGSGEKVLEEAGLSPSSQLETILKYAESICKR